MLSRLFIVYLNLSNEFTLHDIHAPTCIQLVKSTQQVMLRTKCSQRIDVPTVDCTIRTMRTPKWVNHYEFIIFYNIILFILLKLYMLLKSYLGSRACYIVEAVLVSDPIYSRSEIYPSVARI